MTMTRLEAAQRLGLSEREVTAVREHPGGHVATLNGGRREVLIGETVARAYVPEVDDAEEPEPGREPAAEPEAPAPAPQAARRSSRRG